MITSTFNSTIPLKNLIKEKEGRYVIINFPDNNIPEYHYGDNKHLWWRLNKNTFKKFVLEHGYNQIKKNKHQIIFYKKEK